MPKKAIGKGKAKEVAKDDITEGPTLQEEPVDQGGDEGDEEEEVEEVFYVTCDLGKTADYSLIQQNARDAGGYSLIGLDTDKPLLQIGNLTFQGTHDLRIGTDLIYRQTTHAQGSTGTSRKVINFSPVTLTKKQS